MHFIKEAARFFESLPEPILLVAHLDTDGLSSLALFEELCESLNKEFSSHILPQISGIFVNSLPVAKSYVFLDGGSALLADLPSKPTLVVDHHQIPNEDVPDHIFLCNPVLHGLNGSRDACSASLSYFIAAEFMQPKLYVPVIGVVGDAQEKRGLHGLNRELFDLALDSGVISSISAPKFFGVFSKPLVKLLSGSHDVKIRGVSRNYRGAKGFLASLGLDAQKTYSDLSDDERAVLIDALRSRVSGDLEFIDHFGIGSFSPPLTDVKQFATLLNACGRLDMAELGVSIARGDADAVARAPNVLNEYSAALRNAMQWYEDAANDASDRVLFAEDAGLVIINAGRNVPPAIAGTLCSMLTRGGGVPSGTVVVAIARYSNGFSKVSSRSRDVSIDLAQLMAAAVAAVGGESGGHNVAAGAIISSSDEDSFVSWIQDNVQKFL